MMACIQIKSLDYLQFKLRMVGMWLNRFLALCSSLVRGGHSFPLPPVADCGTLVLEQVRFLSLKRREGGRPRHQGHWCVQAQEESRMRLVEQHVIARTDGRYPPIDAAAFASKNLWNAANYLVRQAFIQEGGYLNN